MDLLLRNASDARKGAVLLPVAVWLTGLLTFTVIGVESLFAEPHVVFVYARLTAYVTALLVAALTLCLLTLFGLGCGLMLWWLDDALDVGRIAVAVGRSLWSLAIVTWVGVALLVFEPPMAVTVAELMSPDGMNADLQSVPAFYWWTRLSYAAPCVFLALAAWLLSRSARPISAILAVAFGAAVVMAFASALGALGGTVESG